MVRGDYLDYLKILHGSFNAVVGLLFLHQGLLGLRIRKERRAGGREMPRSSRGTEAGGRNPETDRQGSPQGKEIARIHSHAPQ